MSRITTLLIILSLLIGCKKQQNSNSQLTSYGNRQLIIKGNNLNATVQGEITIYNDEVSISKLVDGKPKVNNSKQTNAIFLIQASQKDWQKIEINRELKSLGAIEEYLKKSLEGNGLKLNQSYPFRIETKVTSMTYHIIFKMDDKPHNIIEHKKAKQKFKLENTNVKIIGFWVDENRVGKLTHPGKRTHLHFIEENNKTSGHIDDIHLPKGSFLFIPKVK